MLNYKFYKVFVLNEYNIIKLKQFYKSKTIFIKKFFKDKIYKNTNNSYKRKKITLDDIIGIIDIPPIEGRFQEILSTQKILDTETNIQYDGLVNREFLELVNEIFEEKEKYFEIVKMNINQFKEDTCIN